MFYLPKIVPTSLTTTPALVVKQIQFDQKTNVKNISVATTNASSVSVVFPEPANTMLTKVTTIIYLDLRLQNIFHAQLNWTVNFNYSLS